MSCTRHIYTHQQNVLIELYYSKIIELYYSKSYRIVLQQIPENTSQTFALDRIYFQTWENLFELYRKSELHKHFVLETNKTSCRTDCFMLLKYLR